MSPLSLPAERESGSRPRGARRSGAVAGLRRLQIGALALLAISLLSCGPRENSTSSRPNVLLVTIDTLRADFVHSYGFGMAITPHLDALARRGVLFEMAIAASTATAPSHASIMSSRYVREHSVGHWNGATRLEGTVTLAERFAQADYATAAFVSNVVLKARTGLDRGFAHYDDDLPASESNRVMYFERTADRTGPLAAAWLRGPHESSFFAWVHLQDPHGPYTPPSPFDTKVPELPLRTERELPVMSRNRGRGGIPDYQAREGERRAARYAGLYAGEVAFADHWVGALVAAAEVGAAGEPLIVLVTADHGESLDEGGFFFQHGHSIGPEQARVPFILVAPELEPGRVDAVVSHVDIAPTLLSLAGLPPLEIQSGIALAEAMRGGGLPERTVLSDIGSQLGAYDKDGYFEIRVRRPDPGPDPDPAAIRRAIAHQELAFQRFDRLVGDDGEGAQAGQVVERAPRWRKGAEVPLPSEVVDYLSSEVPVSPAHAMSEEDIERLRALGYLPPKDEAQQSGGSR